MLTGLAAALAMIRLIDPTADAELLGSLQRQRASPQVERSPRREARLASAYAAALAPVVSAGAPSLLMPVSIRMP